jgi:hypothetical protein
MLLPCLATAQADVEPKLGTRNSSKRPIRSLVIAIDFLAKERACPHPAPKTRGHVRWDKNKKSPVIGVLDACDYQLPFRAMLDDMEFTMAHELVYLELALLPQ